MELVPIIYEILIFVTLFLFLVISISYIISRIRKAALVEEEGHDLIVKRSNQITYLHRRPVNYRRPAQLVTRSMQNQSSRGDRNKQPNVKVIRRSGVSRNEAMNYDRSVKNIFYPKTAGRSPTNGSKPRFTIINNNGNGNLDNNGNGTAEKYFSSNGRYANFR
ncbi:MAG: hypothetical protein A2V66_11765 [Ignavibacteria bacterium RBG_13_36_8]|nr:MAG: hypothetical protein A2V66_11765 [Ignavibacteria bacterium RBG_13_36_8]